MFKYTNIYCKFALLLSGHVELFLGVLVKASGTRWKPKQLIESDILHWEK